MVRSDSMVRGVGSLCFMVIMFLLLFEFWGD